MGPYRIAGLLGVILSALPCANGQAAESMESLRCEAAATIGSDQGQSLASDGSPVVPPDHWAYKALRRAAQLALLSKSEASILRKVVTRQQMASLVDLIFTRMNEARARGRVLSVESLRDFGVLSIEFAAEMAALGQRTPRQPPAVERPERDLAVCQARLEKTVVPDVTVVRRHEKEIADLKTKGVEASGKGKLKIFGYGQMWMVAPGAYDVTGNSNMGEPTFRMRRAEFKFQNSLTAKSYYYVMIDPSKGLSTANLSGTNILQDFSINYKPSENLEFRLGQEKLFLSEESFHSSGKLDFVERWQLSRVFGDKRDPGLSVILGNKQRKYQIHASIYNGANQNATDNNSAKDCSLRSTLFPAKDLQIGGFVYRGSNGTMIPRARKDRSGFDFAYTPDRWTLKGEYFTANDWRIFLKGDGKTFDRWEDVTARGWALWGGYEAIKGKLQLLARYEIVDPDTSRSGECETPTTPGGILYGFLNPGCTAATTGWINSGINEERDLTLGLNYWFDGTNHELQMNYTSRREEGPQIPNDLFLINYQMAF